MKITITYEVDSLAKAHEIIAAVENATRQPYRQSGYGANQLGEADAAVRVVESGSAKEEVVATVERKNVSPGPSSIGKIGAKTQKFILDLLSECKLVPMSYTEHLKLLWARDIIKYDGQVYYL